MDKTTKPAAFIAACAHCEYTIPVGDRAVVGRNSLYHERCIGPANRAARGLVHPCPQCRETGRLPDREHARWVRNLVEVEPDKNGNYPCAYGDCRGCVLCRTGMGEREVKEVPNKACPLCDGEGWLTRPAVAVEMEG